MKKLTRHVLRKPVKMGDRRLKRQKTRATRKRVALRSYLSN